MNELAIFKLSYGLFYLGASYGENSNVCVINTVAQVTQEPIRISVTVQKTSCTASLIEKSGAFSVGIMGADASLDDIAHFGQTSGNDTNKMSGYDFTIDKLSNPVYSKGCIATLCGKVIQTIDLGTHYLFIADLVDAEIISDAAPITYADYRAMKSGKSITTQSTANASWQCSVCHYIYDGEIPFEDLPDDYICPVCKKGKNVFVKI